MNNNNNDNQSWLDVYDIIDEISAYGNGLDNFYEKNDFSLECPKPETIELPTQKTKKVSKKKQRTKEIINSIEIKSHGTIVPLTEYKTEYDKCEFGCLICNKTFFWTPQRLKDNKYECPNCRHRSRLEGKGYNVIECEVDEDYRTEWKIYCSVCGKEIPDRYATSWKECRFCKIDKLYGREYIIDYNDYYAEYNAPIEIEHSFCRRTFTTRMSLLLKGKTKCPYC